MRRGTVALQLPHFRTLIPAFDSFFDGRIYPGTLNVQVPRRCVLIGKPAYHLTEICWEPAAIEHFYLSPCTLRYSGQDYRGFLYIPDPDTKPAGLPVGRVLEVITSKVRFIRYGSPVRLIFDSDAVNLVRQPLVRSRPGVRGPGRLGQRGAVTQST